MWNPGNSGSVTIRSTPVLEISTIPRRLLEVQMRDEAEGVRLPGHDGDFVGNDGEIVLRRGGGATVDEQHLIRADEWILHQEISAVVGGDLDHANFHERALDGLSLFIQHET